MSTFDNLQQEWSKYRTRLEREIRVLVVHENDAVRDDLDRLLFRHHISSRSVPDPEQIVDLVSRDHCSLLMLDNDLPGMADMGLVHSLRQAMPDIDVLVVSSELAGPVKGRAARDLVRGCIDAGVLDVLPWPLGDEEVCGERVRLAVKRNVDRRMRAHVLRQLREELEQLDEDERRRITGSLERRLGQLKRWIGSFERVLVQEGADPVLREVSESLLVGGLEVEASDVPEETWKRIEAGDLHLVVMQKDASQPVDLLLQSVRDANPLSELILISREPDLDDALAALRAGVALLVPWPPADLGLLVRRIQRARQQSLRDRLLDSLLAALFWETHDVLEADEAAFEAFCELAGMERRLPRPALEAARGELDEGGESGMVDRVLDRLDQQVDQPEASDAGPGPEPAAVGEHERRAHTRVMENQFVRFRPEGGASSVLAYLGDISEGGLFIRTGRLQPRGSQMLVDVNLEHEELGYLVRCQGEVAWVAQDDSRVVYGPGFGVRFVHPPRDVTVLLKRVVASRTGDDD